MTHLLHAVSPVGNGPSLLNKGSLPCESPAAVNFALWKKWNGKSGKMIGSVQSNYVFDSAGSAGQELAMIFHGKPFGDERLHGFGPELRE
jgi:hypothetical protein